MSKKPNIITITSIIAFVLILFLSCNESNNNNDESLKKSESNLESQIDFKTVALLNETNTKIIDIASIAFNNSRKLNESKVILKIKKDHTKIESDLKKITENNLIIIPEPIFDLDINNSFIKNINSNFYLISLLKKEINNQIKLLNSIEKVSKDSEFKNFAQESKELLKNNKELLEELL